MRGWRAYGARRRGKDSKIIKGRATEKSFIPSLSWFHHSFASIGNAVKIFLRWVTWYRRAFVTVMPKRGKKGAVAEDGEEPKTGKRMK